MKQLIFLGPPRTATTTIFTALGKHPEIACSKVKEPLNYFENKNTLPKNYFDNFYITENTKVLLDGTPLLLLFPYDQIKIHKKVIYPVRRPFDRLYSGIKLNMINSYLKPNETYPPNYKIDKYRIDENKLLIYIKQRVDSVYIKRAFDMTSNKKDVLIFRFGEWDIQKILKFIGVYPMDIEIEKLNHISDDLSDNTFMDIKEHIDYIWRKNYQNIAEIILNDLLKIRNLVFVDDWIEEIQNDP
jgi:hypothetical protein